VENGLKALAGLVVAVMLLIAAMFAYTTVRGYTTWYFMVTDSRITVDGKPTNGRLHRMTFHRGTTYFLTRKGEGNVESYRVTRTDRGDRVSSCKGWTAPHWIVFPLNHQEMPCIVWVAAEEHHNVVEEPPPRNLQVGPNFLEFTADDGKRVRASW
jgi:hypothetical protein